MFGHKKKIETHFQCPGLTNKLLKLGGKAFKKINFGSKNSKKSYRDGKKCKAKKSTQKNGPPPCIAKPPLPPQSGPPVHFSYTFVVVVETFPNSLADCLPNWLTDGLTNCLTGWLTDRLAVCLNGRLTEWLTDRPTEWLPSFLTAWMTDCLCRISNFWLIYWPSGRTAAIIAGHFLTGSLLLLSIASLYRSSPRKLPAVWRELLSHDLHLFTQWGS